MNRFKSTGAVMVAMILLTGVLVSAQHNKQPAESEREVQASDVPAKAMTMLKAMAGGAAITAFAEEIEHGGTFYEGSWKGPDGHVDGLVTAAGDMVELEESIPAGKVPAAVRAAADKHAGKGTDMKWEKKTVIMYEAHFEKGGRSHEIVLLPDGRTFKVESKKAHDHDEDEDEDEDQEDDG